MKGSKTKGKSTKTSGATASSSGQRGTGAASKIIFPSQIPQGKNSKEAFLKKIKICMKNFEYSDETKDVKGKVSELV